MKSNATRNLPVQRDQKNHVEKVALTQLQSSGYYALRHVSCELDGNVLRLGGRVPSYYEKQIAQSLVLQQLAGDLTLANQLEVAVTN